MNIKFCYMYRDAANYKIFNEVIFKNSTIIDIVAVKEFLRHERCFDPKIAGLPVLRFKVWDEEIDHSYHEFFDLVETENPPTDASQRTFLEFLNDLKVCCFTSIYCSISDVN